MKLKSDKVSKLLFLKKFLKHGTRVASFTPSSITLSKEICRFVNPITPQIIVELGCGTGSFTQVICDRMHYKSKLFSFELDPQFAEITTKRCPKATVILSCAKSVKDELLKKGIKNYDLLINGLAPAHLPINVNEAIFSLFAEQNEQCRYSQLTQVPWFYKRMYKRLFHEVHFKLINRNLPPGGVYHCRSIRKEFIEHLPGKN